MLVIGNVSSSEWDHVKAIGQLHNRVVIGEVEQKELNDYVSQHEKELSTPTIASILLENVEISESYIRENPEYSQLVYKIIHATDFSKADIGLRGDIRKGMFLDFVEEILLTEEQKEE